MYMQEAEAGLSDALRHVPKEQAGNVRAILWFARFTLFFQLLQNERWSEALTFQRQHRRFMCELIWEGLRPLFSSTWNLRRERAVDIWQVMSGGLSGGFYSLAKQPGLNPRLRWGATELAKLLSPLPTTNPTPRMLPWVKIAAFLRFS